MNEYQRTLKNRQFWLKFFYNSVLAIVFVIVVWMLIKG